MLGVYVATKHLAYFLIRQPNPCALWWGGVKSRANTFVTFPPNFAWSSVNVLTIANIFFNPRHRLLRLCFALVTIVVYTADLWLLRLCQGFFDGGDGFRPKISLWATTQL
jgi:hypothetical protein